MNALRRARRSGRFLAAWLLLWFIAMAAPIGSLGRAEAHGVSISVAADEHCTEGHEHTHQHLAGSGEHGAGPHTDHLHTGHAGGSLSHCALCMHAAAPPALQFAPRFAGESASDRPMATRRTSVRVRTAAPPPGRGPPVIS
jgi:hypothetical protein